MRPWCIRFGGERDAKKNEKLIIKMQHAAANNIISSRTYFFKEPADKKKQKIEGSNWRSYYRCNWCKYHIKDALDNHEQTGGRAGCKRPRQRGTDASFTCVLLRSCRDVRRPRHLPNAKLRLFFNLIQMGPRKTIFAFVRVCQLNTGTYHVCHIYAEIPSRT